MRTILIIVFMSIGLSVHAQTYTIIHTIGKIYESESGKYLSKGMRIDESAKLKFESEGAKAAVLSSSRGRFVIQKQEAAGTKNEMSYALASVLSPARGRLSTRAGGINNKLDFEKKFGDGPVAILGSTYKVAISPTAYPMDDNKFFYASFTYNGEPINKKLSNEGDSLVIDVVSFYSIDDNPIDPTATSNLQLFYYDATGQTSTPITQMELVVINKEDIRYLMDHIGGSDSSERQKGVLDIISALYGKCSENDLKRALAQN